MYLETIDHFAEVAAKKAAFMKRAPGSFWVSSMMAGAYVGLGIILIFSVGNIVSGAGFMALGYRAASGAVLAAPKPIEAALPAE